MNELRNLVTPEFSASATKAFAPLQLLLYAVLLLIGPPSITGAQSDSCVFYSDYNSELWMRFPSTNFVSGEFMVYGDDSCQGEAWYGIKTGPLGYVHAATQKDAASICSDVHDQDLRAHRDFTKYSSQVIWWCRNPDAPPPSGGGPSGSGPNGAGPGAGGDNNERAPVASTCETLVKTTNLKVSATYGLGSGIQCQRVNPAVIGNAAVQRQGIQDAVDIWGYAEQGYQLCYPQPGRVVFLDAATSPRAVVNVNYSQSNGYTCVSHNRAGTAVLVAPAPTESQPVKASAPRITPGTYDSISSAILLNDCNVTPSTTLKLRAAPWGRSLALARQGRQVKATARTHSWFKIDTGERIGWIAAWLTSADVSCSGSGPGHASLPLGSHRGNLTANLTGS